MSKLFTAWPLVKRSVETPNVKDKIHFKFYAYTIRVSNDRTCLLRMVIGMKLGN